MKHELKNYIIAGVGVAALLALIIVAAWPQEKPKGVELTAKPVDWSVEMHSQIQTIAQQVEKRNAEEEAMIRQQIELQRQNQKLRDLCDRQDAAVSAANDAMTRLMIENTRLRKQDPTPITGTAGTSISSASLTTTTTALAGVWGRSWLELKPGKNGEFNNPEDCRAIASTEPKVEKMADGRWLITFAAREGSR